MFAAGPPEFSGYICRPFFFCQTVQVIVHDDPLPERFVDPEPEDVVKVGEPCQEDDCPVPGIHIEVEQDL